MTQEEKVKEVRAWIDVVGRATGLHIGHLAQQIDDQDVGADELVDAIAAVLTSETGAFDRLDALKDFFVQQLMVEEETAPLVVKERSFSPYDVPFELLREVFPFLQKSPSSRANGPRVHDDPLYRFRLGTYYDTIGLGDRIFDRGLQ